MKKLLLPLIALANAACNSPGKENNAELVDKKYGHSLDYNMLNQIKTFVIRTKTKQIWIQMTLMNDESGKLTVLEK